MAIKYIIIIRPHMGLNGMTPAQACGIDIQGDNKWLIQNASRREA
jgi:putative transposase